MLDLNVIYNLLDEIWIEPLCSELVTKKVDVSRYGQLSKQIPDKLLRIEEVFPKDELGEIWDNYEPYLSEYQIFPFLGTLGEAVICIGYGGNNQGKMFYFDFDFGCIPFGGDSLKDFLEKLIDS